MTVTFSDSFEVRLSPNLAVVSGILFLPLINFTLLIGWVESYLISRLGVLLSIVCFGYPWETADFKSIFVYFALALLPSSPTCM